MRNAECGPRQSLLALPTVETQNAKLRWISVLLETEIYLIVDIFTML